MLIHFKKLLLLVAILELCTCRSVLALDSTELMASTLNAAIYPLDTVSAVVVQLRSPFLVIVASVILIISLVYLFYLAVEYLINKSRYSKHRLRAECVELKAANEKLRHEINRLNLEHVGSLEHMIEIKESPQRELPEIDPKKLKHLVDLANRLR